MTTRKLSFLGFRRSVSESGPNGGDQNEVRLDDEMEKVFAMSGGLQKDHFDVAEIANDPSELPTPTVNSRQYGEKEFNSHRKKSYPHIHVPLKAIHSRSMKRRVTSPHLSETETTRPSSSNDTETPPLVESPQTVRSPSESIRQDPGTQSSDNPDTGAPSVVVSPISSSTQSPVGTATSSEEPHDDVANEDLFSSGGSEIPEDPPGYPSSPNASDRRVQFIMGIPDIPEHSDGNADDHGANDKKSARRKGRHHHHHHSHHHRFRKYSLQEDLEWRKRSGLTLDIDRAQSRRVSIQPEDAVLQEADIDGLTSHRSDDTRSNHHRRHKIPMRSPPDSPEQGTVHIGRKEGLLNSETLEGTTPFQAVLKKMYDRNPHSVFVQLDELIGEGDEREWKETARWIKYEEDVEEGADRWGKPHVASLSFHSLLNLRRCLETGVVLLDLEEHDLPGVAYRVVEQMVIDELIEEGDKPIVMRALLLRHRHVHESERGFRFGKRHYSSYSSLQNFAEGEKRKPSLLTLDEKRKASLINMETLTANKNSSPALADSEGRLIIPENHTIVDLKEETYTSSIDDLKRVTNETILKRIPIGSEATTVLVGCVDFLEQPTIAFVRLAEGIVMPSITEVAIPVRFLFILLGPRNCDLDYHEVGRSISTLMANPAFHKTAYKADDRKALLSAINEFLDDSIVLPPGDWEQKALLPFDELKAKSEMIRRRKEKALHPERDEETKSLIATSDFDGKKPPFYDPLRRTKRPFGGLINDLKRRYPFYVSDIVDGFNGQCFAGALFMYFACLSGAITFGGLMSDKTENMIGIAETLVATALFGMFFAMCSGQPLIIIGATGPLLLFDQSLYQFCISNGIEFLTLRVYVGFWILIIGVLVASVEGSVLVKLFTRFTAEIFSALISLIYMVESVMKLIAVYGENPLLANYCDFDCVSGMVSNASDTGFNNTTYEREETDNMTIAEALVSPELEESMPNNQPNTALFCTILALGTFAIAYYLRIFRNSKFLGRNARRALGDFGVPIAIIIMVSLDYFIPQTYTEKLRVPEGLSPSNPDVRSWVINPAGSAQPMQLWLAFAAGIPALLVYILIFMETHITELIMDKKERKLKKGSGFHIDIVLICLCNAGCGLIGAPWVSAATVRSVAHISALTVMSQTHAPGDKPRVVEVKEQRLSALIVSILIGLSVLMSPLLRLVPVAVLFGVFLYMGISSMDGIQFFDRIKLYFMPVKHHPSVTYVRRVQTYKMHLYTFIQLLCLTILWIVKSTKASLAFPFFLVLMLPLRAQLQYVFTEKELRALDGDEADDADEDEPDFYAQAPLPG